MNRRIVDLFLAQAVLSTVLFAQPMALAQDISPTGNAGQWVIESEGTATTLPDVVT